MCKYKNIEAARELVSIYRNITIQDINVMDSKLREKYKQIGDLEFLVNEIARELTGYGNTARCTLCNAVQMSCEECIHSHAYEDTDVMYPCTNHVTYDNIGDAMCAEELQEAFFARATYIEKILKEIEEHDEYVKEKCADKYYCPQCGNDEFISSPVFREVVCVMRDKDGVYYPSLMESYPDNTLELRHYCKSCGLQVEIDSEQGVVEVPHSIKINLED